MSDLRKRLFTTHGVPIRYLVIPKSGCTFVKNLLWRLEFGEPHPIPNRIHDDDEKFVRADALQIPIEDLRNEQYCFTIVRNPVARFFSLYSDKVVGPGYSRFPPLRDILVKDYGLKLGSLDVEDHIANCHILADWIEENLKNGNELPKDPHWTPQIYRRNILDEFQLKLLDISNLEEQMRFMTAPLGLSNTFFEGKLPRNATKMKLPKSDILTREVRSRINALYSKDKRLYNLVKKHWKGLDLTSADVDDAPRFGRDIKV